VFVILSAAMPSRLLKAFPPGVPIHRLPLDQAIARVEQRLTVVSSVALEPVK
jgi:ATP-dependent DNA helicase DinG